MRNIEQKCAMVTPKWTGPPFWVININWDMVIDTSTKNMGASTIVKDHEGKVLAFMCSSKPYIIDLTITKALVDGR
jgi:hypothetical protein